MKAFLLHGAKDVRLEEKPAPEPGPGQVLLAPKFTGICGSDVHYYQHGYCGRFVPRRPFALGHEFSGEICRVGPGVQGLGVGDEVAVDPSMPCGCCRHCRSGHYNLCLAMKYFGSASCDPHLDGSLAQYVAVPAANCHVLPAGISLAQAALLEPLCVAMHAVRQVEDIAGASVLITGGGPIGQLILRVVRAFGALKVAVSDVNEFDREFALQSGANAVINPLDEAVWKSGAGYDVVFEASGVPSALANGLEVAHRGGSLVLVGTLPEEFSIPGNLIMNRQLKVLGSFRFANVFEKALALVAAGIINLDGIVTATYGFGEVPQAMQRALSKDRVMKVQVAS
ncbi:MAG: NAD(P)-dependent alcohol dehydrogenase [Verrucomicrobia bacterium]|nr:NAD(P)-dependent alcohol dehydrogenase [Verrucomicrobiota bacterium]